MAQLNTILLQKTADGASVVDAYANYNIACTNFPFSVGGEIQDMAYREWVGEDGEDTYFPETIAQKAYDIDVELCYKGSVGTAFSTIESFKEYCFGSDGYGTELQLYNPYTGIGRTGVYLKKIDIDDDSFVRSNTDEVLTFTATFRVTDPVSAITLTT